MNGFGPATPEGIAAAQRLREAPGLTAAERLARVAAHLSTIASSLRGRDAAWLRSAADDYERQARDLAVAAVQQSNGKPLRGLLELAGLHTIRAGVYRAKAAELEVRQ